MSAHSTPSTSDSNRPPLLAGIPFYYYADLATAVRWYREVFGANAAWQLPWVALLELSPSIRVGLVDEARGLERAAAADRRGSLLALETTQLESWRERLVGLLGSEHVPPLAISTDGHTEAFLVRDPGGYAVEFFRWRTRVSG